MKKTIKTIQEALKETEKLAPDALTSIKGGGCDDKRKDIDSDSSHSGKGKGNGRKER